VTYFSGGWNYPSQPMKGKSDYAKSPMGDAGITALMEQVLARTAIYVVCDSYGGAIANVGPDATTFPHRGGTRYCIFNMGVLGPVRVLRNSASRTWTPAIRQCDLTFPAHAM
jgi:hypothetical protein